MSLPVRSDDPVTLVGGGPVATDGLSLALGYGPMIVAADGGAGSVLAAGHMPDKVIGDLDSLGGPAKAAIAPDRLCHIPEQESTDFHKCLSRIDAPLVLALGVTGGRMDHLLAVFNSLVRLPERRCVVIGQEDVCVVAPPDVRLDVPIGTTVSLFPMAPVTAQSDGLRWPVGGLSFAPDGQSGTSNRADGPVRLVTHEPKLLLMLPLEALGALIDGLAAAPGWVQEGP